jgi:hypothetical protein
MLMITNVVIKKPWTFDEFRLTGKGMTPIGEEHRWERTAPARECEVCHVHPARNGDMAGTAMAHGETMGSRSNYGCGFRLCVSYERG